MLTTKVFVIRLLVAAVLGIAIGVERQWRQKSAGLRTNTLVALGSAAFVLMSVNLGTEATGRMASYIISGIGFLGAGVIMKDGMSVQGLNTAATIWCSAAVGSLAGIGMAIEAAILTAAIMLAHLILRPIGNMLSSQPLKRPVDASTDYLVTIKCRQEVENHIRVLMIQSVGNDNKLLLRSLASTDMDEGASALITAEIRSESPQDILMEKVTSRLTIEQAVSNVSWKVATVQIDN
ncbi:MgtC/SapB family protein [Chitinophaga silvatica]|uniref:Protein MgtC n=1 Tax=Chitinophaga silvatica TaxID=2282649 RepID=A0A3E1Y604_9BACT|nr:MgtC/SapB family protein [Chitinophaga silvatica]RFS20168.1 MgtC/SapB family protein [Chitinophaga silvatica]